MKHRFKKAMFRYLLEIVSDGDATNKIIQDLSRQTSNANVQFQLCQTFVNQLEGKLFISHVQVEKIIEFVCDSAKRIGVYDKETANRILSLIMTDSIIHRCYAEIAEAFVFILDDRTGAEDILKRAFGILKNDMQDRTKMTMISESASDGVNTHEHYSCCTLDFTRLAYVWIGVGRDREYAKEIVGYGSQHAVGFIEHLELGEFFIRFPEERYTAIKYFRRAEEMASDFDDHCCLCHNLFLYVKNDVWAKQVMDKCRSMARSADDFCRLAEIAGNPNGLLQKQLCRELLEISISKTTCHDERRAVEDSIEDIRESWTDNG